MRINFLNGAGDGLHQPIQVADGTTFGELLSMAEAFGNQGGRCPEGYQARVRRGSQVFGGAEGSALTPDFALVEGDTVSIVKTKFDSGC